MTLGYILVVFLSRAVISASSYLVRLIINTCTSRVALFSVVSVCMFICLSVSGLLEISSEIVVERADKLENVYIWLRGSAVLVYKYVLVILLQFVLGRPDPVLNP